MRKNGWKIKCTTKTSFGRNLWPKLMEKSWRIVLEPDDRDTWVKLESFQSLKERPSHYCLVWPKNSNNCISITSSFNCSGHASQNFYLFRRRIRNEDQELVYIKGKFFLPSAGNIKKFPRAEKYSVQRMISHLEKINFPIFFFQLFFFPFNN